MSKEDKLTVCPNCKTHLKISGAGKYRCPLCKTVFQVSEPTFSYVESTQQVGYCEFHSSVLANYICQSCGALLCDLCAGDDKTYPICPRCKTKGFTDEPIKDPKRYLTDLSSVLFKPTEFFSSIPPRGNIGRAIIFGVLWATVGNFVAGIWSYEGFKVFFNKFGAQFGSSIDTSAIFSGSYYIGNLIGSAIGFLILLFLSTLVIHLFLLISGDAKMGIEATLKGLAYAQATNIWSAVPFLGALLAPIWWLICATIALKNLHRTTTAKALFAILAPAIIVMVLVIVAIVAFFAFFASMLGSSFHQPI